MTRSADDAAENGRADEAFDRLVGGALREQADARFFAGLAFDDRMRQAIRARAQAGPALARRRRWWAWMGALSAAAALLLAFRLSSAPVGWKAASQVAGGAEEASRANAASEAVPQPAEAGLGAAGAPAPEAAPALDAEIAAEGRRRAAPVPSPADGGTGTEDLRLLEDPEAVLARAEQSLGFHVLRPAALPPGAALVGVTYDPLLVRQVYRLPGGATIEITQFDGGLVDRNDPAHPANRGGERVVVNGAEGWLTRSGPGSGVSGGWAVLTWRQDRFQFAVAWSEGGVPVEEILAVAASLR